MSASELMRLTVKTLTDKREIIAGRVHAIRYEYSQLVDGGAVVAPPTVEDIAMRTVEANAAVRTYDDAITIINEIYRKMTAPDTGQPKAKREAPYA